MKQLNSYIKFSLIGILITFIVFVILNLNDKKGFLFEMHEPANGKDQLDINFQKQYRGILTAKYLDINNHSFETIEIRLNDSSEYYWVTYGPDSSDFYKFIQVNDSIIKKDWGFRFYIKRNGIDTSFVVHPDYVEEEENKIKNNL